MPVHARIDEDLVRVMWLPDSPTVMFFVQLHAGYMLNAVQFTFKLQMVAACDKFVTGPHDIPYKKLS